MKYFDMLKSFDFIRKIKTAAENYDFSTIDQPVVQPVPTPPPPVNEKLKDDEEELLSLLRDVKDRLTVPDNVDPQTILSEEEVNNILNMLVQLQDNIFSETPIS